MSILPIPEFLPEFRRILSSAKFDQEKSTEKKINTKAKDLLNRVKGKKKVWLPNMNKASDLLAAAMRAHGH
jgi:hypothetical protein